MKRTLIAVGLLMVAGMASGDVVHYGDTVEITVTSDGGALSGTISRPVEIPATKNPGLARTNRLDSPDWELEWVIYGENTVFPRDATDFIQQMKEENALTNTIEQLAETGEICKVLGHQWRPEPHCTLEYAPDLVGSRGCGICGVVQTQRLAGWE